MPNGVALTTRSADPTASARARVPGDTTDPARPASAAAAAARSDVRLRTATRLAPATARASTTARAAPPAPITTHRRPAGVKAAPRAREATKPSPSVLVPSSTPSRAHDAVHGVEPLRHLGALVDQGDHVGLVRHGDREPADVGAAHGLERLPPPGRVPRRRPANARSHPVRARRTPRCAAGATANGRSGCRSLPPAACRDRRRPAPRRWSRPGPAQGRPRLLASCSLASCSA